MHALAMSCDGLPKKTRNLDQAYDDDDDDVTLFKQGKTCDWYPEGP